MGTIGFIINPMAGRDIRRLVAAASLQSGAEKLLVARRILAGVQAVPGMTVIMPRDFDGLSTYIQDEMKTSLPIRLIDVPQIPSAGSTTTEWTGILEDGGADVLVVVGGDGTQRNIAQARPRIPVLPVAGGTNNVACWIGDQTAAGYAAASYVALRQDPQEVAIQSKLLHIQTEQGHEELALIDVALVQQNYTGALAIWHAEDVDTLVLAQADPARPGLSNIGGFFRPVMPWEDRGLILERMPSNRAYQQASVLAPGLTTLFTIGRHRTLELGESVVLSRSQGGSLALDGERTVVLKPGEEARVSLRRDGPFVLDPAKVLRKISPVRMDG